MDFEFIFDYLFEHAWEILLGLEMFCLKIFKKKTPEEIQAKMDKRDKKLLEKKQKKLSKALDACLDICVNSSYSGKTYEKVETWPNAWAEIEQIRSSQKDGDV